MSPKPSQFNVHILQEIPIVNIKFTGVVSIEPVKSMLNALYALPNYKLSMGRLLDISDATVDITREEIQHIIDINLKHYDGITEYKVAVLVSNVIEQMFIQLFKRFSPELHYEELKVFHSREDALSWLNEPLNEYSR